MSRVLALALLALVAACGDAGKPSRLDLIKQRAAQERDKDFIPLPAVRRPQETDFTGTGKRDPFHPG